MAHLIFIYTVCHFVVVVLSDFLFYNNGLDERANDAYNLSRATIKFTWVSILLYFYTCYSLFKIGHPKCMER